MFAVEIFCTFISSLMLAIVHLLARLPCASLGLRGTTTFFGPNKCKENILCKHAFSSNCSA